MDHSRINDLFTRALELGPAAREIFLAQACGDDAWTGWGASFS